MKQNLCHDCAYAAGKSDEWWGNPQDSINLLKSGKCDSCGRDPRCVVWIEVEIKKSEAEEIFEF